MLEGRVSPDARSDLRAALAGVPGEVTSSPCGCEWKRVPPGAFVYHGVRVSGDVVVQQCDYHAWYAAQPLEVQRQVSRQEQARWRGEENRA